MKNNPELTIFLVDDDVLFLKSLEIEFNKTSGFVVKSFPTGEACLESLSQKPDIIVLDYYLNEIDKTAKSGLIILDKIKAEAPEIPVIMLSSQDRLEVSVNCIKHKAYDYVVKSETAFVRLRRIIRQIITDKKTKKELSFYKIASIATITAIILILVAIIMMYAFSPGSVKRFLG